MDELITTYNLPFFEWKGKRVMTMATVSKLHELKRDRATHIFYEHREDFLEGHDVYLLRGVEPYDELPAGITPYRTSCLWLITESGYLKLLKYIKGDLAQKIRLSIAEQLTK